jgi:two-component system, LytTR family, response regulator
MFLKSLIVDDEKRARDLLNSMLGDYCPRVKVVAEADNIDMAYAAIKNSRPDLVFLDIEISDGSGFQLLERVRDEISFKTVLVTAYNQYALKAIKAGASDYILKPIDKDELVVAVDKVYKKHLFDSAFENKTMSDTLEDRIAVPHLKGFKLMQVRDIIRLEADNNYTYLYLHNEPRIVISKTIKYFEERLDSRWFFRTHKSHIINFYHFREYLTEDGGCAIMSDDKKVPISRFKSEEFQHNISLFAPRI